MSENNISSTKKTIVIVGGNGDLSLRKLIPALYALYKRNLLNNISSIIGTGRADLTKDLFIDLIEEKYQEFFPDSSTEFFNEDPWNKLSALIDYSKLSADDPEHYNNLSKKINNSNERNPIIFYLSTVPSLYGMIC